MTQRMNEVLNKKEKNIHRNNKRKNRIKGTETERISRRNGEIHNIIQRIVEKI